MLKWGNRGGMKLRVTDLAVSRGGVPVLEGLSFALSGGGALVLRGPNGAGKTTLLRTLAGLQPPLAGRIEGAGERILCAFNLTDAAQTVTLPGGTWEVLSDAPFAHGQEGQDLTLPPWQAAFATAPAQGTAEGG